VGRKACRETAACDHRRHCELQPHTHAVRTYFHSQQLHVLRDLTPNLCLGLISVRTMTEPALLRRVAAIERAKGAHAVIKMRMFARVAFLEGYDAVADAATEALTRLIEVLGDMPDAPLDGTE